jgi:hypothetical protein
MFSPVTPQWTPSGACSNLPISKHASSLTILYLQCLEIASPFDWTRDKLSSILASRSYLQTYFTRSIFYLRCPRTDKQWSHIYRGWPAIALFSTKRLDYNPWLGDSKTYLDRGDVYSIWNKNNRMKISNSMGISNSITICQAKCGLRDTVLYLKRPILLKTAQSSRTS